MMLAACVAAESQAKLLAKPSQPTKFPGSYRSESYSSLHKSERFLRVEMPVKIDDLLRVATSHGASDLHLKVGAFPVMRIGGELHTVGDAPRLKAEDSLDMAFSVMSNRQKQRFKEVFEADIA